MLKSILVGFSLLTTFCVIAQRDSTLSNKGLFIGYFGETISHPGLNAGLEKTLGGTENANSILSLGVGGYVHRRNNTSLFLRLQWGQRLIFKNGIFLEQFLGLGYLHQFVHGGEKYDVLPNGAVVEKKKTGRPGFMPSVSIGTGYAFKNNGLKLYLRPEFFWKAPFNGYYLTHFAIQTGLIVNI